MLLCNIYSALKSAKSQNKKMMLPAIVVLRVPDSIAKGAVPGVAELAAIKHGVKVRAR